jgi:transcriptional regulator with XRE-family HTH domain
MLYWERFKLRAVRERSKLSKQLALRMSQARLSAGVTQVEIAKRMKTTQTAIARLESGRKLPSTRTLAKFAAAVGRRLVIDFQEISTQSAGGRRDRH